MKDYGQIRQMYIRDGKSIRQIAREMHISRNTVAKYCKGNALPGKIGRASCRERVFRAV